MHRYLSLFVIAFLLFVISCDSSKVDNKKSNDSSNLEESSNEIEINEVQVKNNNDEFPYTIKDNGLYVFVDGPAKKKFHDKKCFDYIQKNYKYLRLDSKVKQVTDGSITTKWQYCSVERSCQSHLGKPSLYELGYERHKEREIKPEDNRFGKEVVKTTKWIEKEKRIYETVYYKFIDAKEFTQISLKEFVNNGIIVIGNHISRVVIKNIAHLPKWGNKILVYYEKTRLNCQGGEISKYELQPEIIANFRRINFKENIFEFINEEPLPEDADYLSDSEFNRLTENIYQFVPRGPADRTIHKKHSFRPGYYIIEYYDEDNLFQYHCVKIGNPGKKPPLTDPLKFTAPSKISQNKNSKKYGVKFGTFPSRSEASDFISNQAPYSLEILETVNGQYIACKRFSNKETASSERKNLIEQGWTGPSLSIILIK